MARFHFKLQRLLRVREVGEELARASFALAESERSAAATALDEARSDLGRAERELAQLRASQKPQASLLAERTLPPLLRRIAARRRILEDAEKSVQRARDEWQAARTDMRALEKLEDRARDAFKTDERAREDRALQETIERRAALAAGNVLTTEDQA